MSAQTVGGMRRDNESDWDQDDEPARTRHAAAPSYVTSRG
jgi:hypothetical protein